jgi:hypothetical protein
MSERRVLPVQKSLIATCALVALILFASFYMVVSDAVQHPRHRMASVEPATQQATPAAAPRNAGRGSALLARVGN